MSEHSDSVKERIINVGCGLWEHDGFEPSIRAIARSVECSHGNIIYHFKSRDQLIDAIAEYAVQADNARVIAHLIMREHAAVRSLSKTRRAEYMRRAGKI